MFRGAPLLQAQATPDAPGSLPALPGLPGGDKHSSVNGQKPEPRSFTSSVKANANANGNADASVSADRPQ